MRSAALLMRAAVGLLALGGALEVPPARAVAQPRDPELYAPWNSPAADARARRGQLNSIPPRAYADHGYDQGLAVAPDGSLLVAATPGQRVNSLDFIDPAARTGWRLAHPHPRVGLIEPTFSADGQKLAFVVGLPSPAGEFTGVSAIWIVDRQGRRLQVIATPGRLYRHPVFSPDGRKLAYARDVFQPVGPGAPLPPENQSAKPMSLFETDLATGQERRLSEETYGYLRPVAYSRDGAQLYVQADRRLVPAAPGASDLVPDDSSWAATPPPPAPIPLRLLRLDLAAGATAEVGGSLAHVPGRGPGALLDLAADGAALIFDAEVQGRDRLAWSIYRADRAQARRLAGGAEPRYVQEPAVSPGGGDFAAVLTAAVAPGSPFDVQGFLLGRLDPGAPPVRLPYAAIRFRPDPVLLDAAQPPTGRPAAP